MPLDNNTPMPFGKHKGKKLADIPDTYLIWLYDNKKVSGSLKKYCEENIEVLKIQARQQDCKRLKS